jgi:hypothetical protein
LIERMIGPQRKVNRYARRLRLVSADDSALVCNTTARST